jgi:membrane protease YdiL (CAAX protease family)
MIGIFIQLLVSAALLWFAEKQPITALGVFPLRVRARQFILGFVFTAFLCSLSKLFYSSVTSTSWVVNPAYTHLVFLKAIYQDVKSVLFEELLFRGALLYLAIKKLGMGKAILLSALAFGIYHWFSFGALGNPVLMIYVFLSTGLMGFVWALAFARTKSMALPIGLHLGWNVFLNSVFSKGPWGDVLLVLNPAESDNPLVGIPALINFILPILIIPLLCLWYIVKVKKE